MPAESMMKVLDSAKAFMRPVDKYLRVIPRRLTRALRDFHLRILDIRDYFAGSSSGLIPPRSLHFVGGGDFKAIGRALVGHFVEVCQLRPDEKILDIGCGTGRMAIPLLGAS